MEIILIFFVVGFISFIFGLFNIVTNFGNHLYTILAIIGALLIVTSVGVGLYKYDQGSDLLLQDIADQLNAETADIIVEDISEDKWFAPSKNANLRKVHYQDKIYLIEVEDFKVNKMTKLN